MSNANERESKAIDLSAFRDRWRAIYENWRPHVSVRVINALGKNGYDSFENVAGKDVSDLLRINHLGRESIAYIQDTLKVAGLAPLTDKKGMGAL